MHDLTTIQRLNREELARNVQKVTPIFAALSNGFKPYPEPSADTTIEWTIATGRRRDRVLNAGHPPIFRATLLAHGAPYGEPAQLARRITLSDEECCTDKLGLTFTERPGCAAVVFSGNRIDPPEYCEDEAMMDSDYCERHQAAEEEYDPDEMYGRPSYGEEW